jgi:hypothetical protein
VLTVPRVVLDISEKDFSPGLTYVAISRVKTLAGILFDDVFDLEQFRPGYSEKALMRLADITRRAPQHVSKALQDEITIGTNQCVLFSNYLYLQHCLSLHQMSDIRIRCGMGGHEMWFGQDSGRNVLI